MIRKLISLFVVLTLVLSVPVAGYAASSLKTSDSCINVIKELEGFQGKPYVDTDGKYTIGYGTRCPDSKVEYYRNNPMSEAEADSELRKALTEYEKAVNAFADKHGVTFQQGQFDGIISLVYNCGTSCLSNGETLIRALSKGYTGNDLIYAFSIYSMSGGKRSIGHVNRRLAEANMYLYQSYGRYAPDYFSYVLYNENGGKLSTYNVQGYEINSPVAPIPTATYEGKTFLGWYTKASGGTKVTRLDGSTKAMTLYAHYGTADQLEQDQPVMKPAVPPAQMSGMLIPSGAPVSSSQVTVTANSVNLRKGPGTGYSTIGQANKGDKYTITATYQDSQYLWGRFSGGWICLNYTTYQKTNREQTNNHTATKTYATVVDTEQLNVCNAPAGEVVDILAKGAKVELLEQQTVNDSVWGRYSGGWIDTGSHVKLEDISMTPTTVTNMYVTVVDTDALNVRKAPDGDIVGSLSAGTKVEILEQKMAGDRLWGRYSGGWICLRSYVMVETATEVVYQSQRQVGKVLKTVPKAARADGWVRADYLNVRSGPGTQHEVVSDLRRGDPVSILEYATANGKGWGRIEAGWICLNYVQF